MLFLFGGGRKDEDYEDDMFLECGSWKDHHGSMMNRVRSELMVKTTREGGRNNFTI